MAAILKEGDVKKQQCKSNIAAILKRFQSDHDRKFKKTTMETATGTSLNKRFNEENNGCARAL